MFFKKELSCFNLGRFQINYNGTNVELLLKLILLFAQRGKAIILNSNAIDIVHIPHNVNHVQLERIEKLETILDFNKMSELVVVDTYDVSKNELISGTLGEIIKTINGKKK